MHHTNGQLQCISKGVTAVLHKTIANGFVQDCSNSFANTLELLQSCTKLLISYHSNNMQYYSEVTLQVMG